MTRSTRGDENVSTHRSGAQRLDLIGFDLSGRTRRIASRRAWPMLAAAVLLGLGVTALRVDLIRMRYALADALATESQLLEEQRALTVEMRTLRDPGRLANEAQQLGFAPPERVIALPDRPVRPLQPGTTSDATVLADLGVIRP